MPSGFNYLLADSISALAVVASMIGIYFTEYVIFQRSRRRVLEMIGKALPFPQFRRKKFNTQCTEPNYMSFHTVISRVPLTPIALLTGFTFIAVGWNTSSQKGFYAYLINGIHILKVVPFAVVIILPFAVVITLLFTTSCLLNSRYLSNRIAPEIKSECDQESEIKSECEHLDWKTLYLLRVKRYELYFLFASIGIIFLFLTKTFAYFIYYYPDFTIPFLPFLGILKSYDPNGLGYAVLTTVVLALISYLLPIKLNKCANLSFHELENILLKKANKPRLFVTVTDAGGSKISGCVSDIGSVLGLCHVKSVVGAGTKKDEEKNKCNVKCFIRWNYVSSVEFTHENSPPNKQNPKFPLY